MIGAGALRDRVTILYPSVTDDVQGGQTTTWAVQAQCWAEVVSWSGREQLASGGVQSASSTRITVHYRSDLTAQSRIRRDRDGQEYELVSPPRDTDGRRIWLELDAVEVRA